MADAGARDTGVIHGKRARKVHGRRATRSKRERQAEEENDSGGDARAGGASGGRAAELAAAAAAASSRSSRSATATPSSESSDDTDEGQVDRNRNRDRDGDVDAEQIGDAEAGGTAAGSCVEQDASGMEVEGGGASGGAAAAAGGSAFDDLRAFLDASASARATEASATPADCDEAAPVPDSWYGELGVKVEAAARGGASAAAILGVVHAAARLLDADADTDASSDADARAPKFVMLREDEGKSFAACVRALLAAGALDADALAWPVEGGETTLHTAIRCRIGALNADDVVAIVNAATPDVVDARGRTALHLLLSRLADGDLTGRAGGCRLTARAAFCRQVFSAAVARGFSVEAKSGGVSVADQLRRSLDKFRMYKRTPPRPYGSLSGLDREAVCHAIEACAAIAGIVVPDDLGEESEEGKESAAAESTWPLCRCGEKATKCGDFFVCRNSPRGCGFALSAAHPTCFCRMPARMRDTHWGCAKEEGGCEFRKPR
mmetsp:Transcript_25884/g.90122  ORF Transcript_25884/g.90122 Transcript_25884/m.90122 type:complete len:494 (-) Transcript_25884:234-1715(-)